MWPNGSIPQCLPVQCIAVPCLTGTDAHKQQPQPLSRQQDVSISETKTHEIPPSLFQESRLECINRLKNKATELEPRINWTEWIDQRSTEPREATFIRIYEKSNWGDSGQGSGQGSSLEFSVPIRCYLNKLIYDFKIDTIVDAPCGSFWWMKHFLEENPHINYIGVDIMPALIKHHNTKYKSDTREFYHGDLVDSELFSKIKDQSKIWKGTVLLMVRHAIEHNTGKDGMTIFHNIQNSAIPLFFGTTHVHSHDPPETLPGGYSKLNFEFPPFNLPHPIELFYELGNTWAGLWTLPFQDWHPDPI